MLQKKNIEKYLYNYKENGGRNLYDSSLNSVGEYADVGEIYDSSKEDENGYYKEVDGLYKICVGSYRNMGGRFDEGYTIKLVIVDKNIGKVIYEVDDEASLTDFTKIDNYYVMSIYKSNKKTTERVIIDSTTGEQLYSGDGYIYIDDFNNKLVVIKKKVKSPTNTNQPTETTENKVSKLKAKTKKVNVKKGKKSSLTYNYTAQDNKKSLTENVKISSSKKSIVKIVNRKLSNGKVTVGIKAVKKGTANITVKIGDKTATTKVVVK